MAHLAARTDLGLAVEMQAGAVLAPDISRQPSASAPIRLRMSTGARARRVEPSGKPATARICCSNCEVTAPSSVQWPELWTRGAISLTTSLSPPAASTTHEHLDRDDADIIRGFGDRSRHVDRRARRSPR